MPVTTNSNISGAGLSGTAVDAVNTLGAIAGLSTANTAAAATANTTIIQTALNGGGQVQILTPGVYNINKTLLVPSYTTFFCRLGARLKKFGGLNQFYLIRNKYAQNGCYVNGAVVSGGQITINDYGHPWNVGDQVYVEGMLTNTTLNGPKTVLATTPGVSWTYAATGANPTNTSIQQAFTSPYYPLAGSGFVRASNVVTVQESGHTRGVGDRLWIVGLGGTNTFNGVAEITSSTPGTSWTYANTGANETATGTAQVLGDRSIRVALDLDGNSPNMTYNQWGVSVTLWGNISKFEGVLLDSRYGIGGRVINVYNATDFNVPSATSSKSVAVLVQFDSYCDRCNVGTIFGQDASDDLLAWGTTSAAGVFGDTAQPTGPGSMGTLTVGNLIGDTPTGIFKCYATTGTDLGSVTIGTIKGKGPLSIGDPTTGVTGGTIQKLTIGYSDTYPQGNSPGMTITIPITQLDIGTFIDTPSSAASTGVGLLVGAAVGTISIRKYVALTQRTAVASVLFNSNVTNFKIGMAETVCGAGPYVFYANPGVVETFEISNWTHTGSANTNAQLIYGQSNGQFKTVMVSNFRETLGGGLFGANSAGLTHNIYLNNVHLDNVSQCVGGDVSGTYNIFANNINCLATASNLLQFYVAGQTVRYVGKGTKAPAGQYCLFTGTTSISINDPDFKIDLGASGGAPPSQLVPLAGDQVFNTNATGGGVYGRRVAGTWLNIF